MKREYYDKMLRAIEMHESSPDPKNKEIGYRQTFKLIPFFEKEYEENCKTMKFKEIYRLYSHIMIYEQWRNPEDYLTI